MAILLHKFYDVMQWCKPCIISCANHLGPHNGSYCKAGNQHITSVNHQEAALSDLDCTVIKSFGVICYNWRTTEISSCVVWHPCGANADGFVHDLRSKLDVIYFWTQNCFCMTNVDSMWRGETHWKELSQKAQHQLNLYSYKVYSWRPIR